MESSEFHDYENLPTASPWAQMVGGAVAGVMEHCLVYPLDSVKTRMQSLNPCSEARYRGVGDALWRMVRHEGVLRPVRGMPAVVIGAGPAHAAYFVTYENLRDSVQRARVVPHSLAPGVAGIVATLIHDAVMTPADAVKQRMQVFRSPFSSCAQCARFMYRQDGLAAFYRAYGTQLTMNIPFQAIHFICYERMQQLTNPERRYWPAAHMLSGAVAGAVAATVTTPLDVCKTLLNTQEAAGGGSVVGLTAAARCVYGHGGATAFLRGLQARVAYQIPSTAICWTIYEWMKYLLTDSVDREEARAPERGAGGGASAPAGARSVSRNICPSVAFTTAKAHPASRYTEQP